MVNAYSPLKTQDDDDDFDLLNLGPPLARDNAKQGAQGASFDFDPFAFKPEESHQKPKVKGPSNAVSGLLFDEDDIVGVMTSSDPFATAENQRAKANANF